MFVSEWKCYRSKESLRIPSPAVLLMSAAFEIKPGLKNTTVYVFSSNNHIFVT